ncbi:MAG: Cna B-type domain-containing protein [Clostridia bacterium]|nr:Cna B-type domain-containing protein [Clostridia bacterium]
MLVPAGHVELMGEDHNGAIIANSIFNNQEIHQRTLAPKGRSTWVKMDGGYIALEKASLGYDWSIYEWVDMSNTTNLSGAVFGVYSNENCTEENLVATMTTDARGEAISDMVAAGTYWVKEITPLKDHNLQDDVFEVTVDSGATARVLPEGYDEKYDGYYHNIDGNWIWISGARIVNQQNNGYASVRLVKHDEFGNELRGAEFGIYTRRRVGPQHAPRYEYTLVASATTNSNGVAVFEDIPLTYTDEGITYYVREINPPEGYLAGSNEYAPITLRKDARDKLVTVDGNGKADGVAFTNAVIRGNLALKKVDARTGDALYGAEFTIYSDDACTKPVGNVMETNANGVATSANVIEGKDGLVPGTYYVKETGAPENYFLPQNPTVYTVHVKAGEIRDVVTDTTINRAGDSTPIGNARAINISGTKTWPGIPTEVADSFKIKVELWKYAKDGNGQLNWQYVKEVEVSKETNWAFSFENLPTMVDGEEIQYEVRENKNGVTDSWKYQTYVTPVEDAYGNITVSIVNTLKRTVVQGSKKWTHTLSDNDGRPNQIMFTLYQQVGDELIPVKQNNNYYTYNANKNDNYAFSFYELPTYGPDGNEAVYVVKEEESDQYTVVRTETAEPKEKDGNIVVEITLTNALTAPLRGTKVWNDNSNASGARPDDVTLKVFRMEEGSNKATEVPAKDYTIVWDKETNADVWTWEVQNLPKYHGKDSKLCSYYVVEEPKAAGYLTPTYSNTSSTDADKAYDGGTITNSLFGRVRLYKESETETKMVNGENRYIRLGGATFMLYSDSECKNPVLSAPVSTKTSGEVGELEISPVPYGTYYIQEVDPPAGYEWNSTIYTVVVDSPVEQPSDIEGGRLNQDNNTDTNVVTNRKITANTTSVTVTKEWADGEPEGEAADVSASLTLYKGNDEEVTKDASGADLRVSRNGNQYTWSNLPAEAEDGTAIVYYVKESKQSGYAVPAYSNTDTTVKDKALNGGSIFNAKTVSATVEATKSLNNVVAPAEQFSFTLTDKKTPATVLTEQNNENGKVIFTVGPFDAVGTYNYTLEEVIPEGAVNNKLNGVTYDDTKYTVVVTVARDAANKLVAAVDYNQSTVPEFRNTYEAEGTEQKLNVSKQLLNWAHVPNGEEHTFEFTLVAAENCPAGYTIADGTEEIKFTKTSDGAETQTVTDAFKVQFTAANSYEFTVTESRKCCDAIVGDTGAYKVTVKVEDVAGKLTVTETKITKDSEEVQSMLFVNTYQVTSISGTKVWDDANNQDGVRPDSITINVMNGTTLVASQTLTAANVDASNANVWNWTFTDLPKYTVDATGNATPIVYTVEEVTTDANDEKLPWGQYYSGKVEENATKTGYIITNTHAPGTVNITVTKVWEDNNATNRPAITLTLYKGENVVVTDAQGEKLAPTVNGNEYTWSGLPEKENGQTITYYVKETVPAGYEVEYPKNAQGEDQGYAENGQTITNKLVTTSISGTKVWDDANNQDGVRPDSITIKLLAGGQPTDKSVTLTATNADANNANVWNWTFTDLPKYTVDATGNATLIEYTVEEVTTDAKDEKLPWVQYYTGKVEENATKTRFVITNTHAPGTVNITVTKVWEDNNATSRPAITLTLYKGENVVVTDAQGEKLAPTVNDNKYTWSNLPEKENGKIIVYYVKEDAAAQGYKEPAYTNTEANATVTDKALNGGTITNTLAEGEASFDITKTLVNGAYLAEGQTKSFIFALYEYDNDEEAVATTTITLPAADDSTENVLGQIKFDLKFGTHTYLLKEVKGTDADIDYDGTQYKLELTAGVNKFENPGTLGLNDFKFTTMEGKEVTSLAFSNTYKYEADGVLDLEATKAMSSDSDVQTMKDDQFTFGIFKGEVQVSTGTNAENGTIVFDEISYDQSDIGATYLYTVKELPGIAEDETYNYFYDETVYTVSVSVEDGRNGELIVTKTITKGAEAVDAIEFTNTIKNKVGHIGVMKVDKADDKKGLADAVFGVYTQVDADDKIVKTSWVGDIRTGETGAGSLQNLPIGTYYVQESMAPKGYQLDETVYTVVVEEGKTALVNGEKVFNAKLGRLMLRKADRLNPDKALPGAVYTLYSDEACLPETKVADITTGDDGIGYLDDVAPGTYWVKETKAPVGYEVDPLPYKVVVEENPDPEKPAFVQVTDFPLRGALVISKTVVGVEDTTETFLFDIELSIATADPIVGSYEATLNGVATEKVTFAASDKGARATVSLKSGDTLAISGVREGVTYTVTEQSTGRYDVTVNNVKTNVATGTIKEAVATVAAFQNTLKQTGFTVEKVWQGAEGGEIELTLFANGVKVEPQPEYTKEGNKYSYADLTMVDEKGQEILYTVKETAMAGYTTSYKNIAPYADKTDCAYNGGQIINQALTSFSVKKEWAGLAEGETAPAIQLTLYCNGTIVTKATPKPDAKGWYVYTDLPATVEGKAAVYTVKEEPLSGYTTTYINKGENAAVTDCAYNGSTIVNSKIPQTGDGTPLALWMTTMLLAALGLVGLKAYSRKREN